MRSPNVPNRIGWHFTVPVLLALWASEIIAHGAIPALHTFGGTDDVSRVEVMEVYFLPKGRAPVPDWHDRLNFFAQRLQAFHQREFSGQSKLHVTVWPELFVSDMTADQIRNGDRDTVFDRTVNSVRDRLQSQVATNVFPIFLALSDINWRELDDFRRMRMVDGIPRHEGYVAQDGRHFPGAESGGARALYDPDKHCGLGLVSADGWRVPYGGSDCVVYHEGLGHTVGLPHPDPMNDSVMGTAQYVFALNETWLDERQKRQMGWGPGQNSNDLSHDLFTKFSVKYYPPSPAVGQEVSVQFTWPTGAQLDKLSVATQTTLYGPWHEMPVRVSASPPDRISLGSFSEATPVSYRVRVALRDSQSTEIWGYFQVRDPRQRTFWYDYQFDQQPKRLWSRTAEDQWSELYPDGHTTFFREIAPQEVEGLHGIVARRLPSDGFEVWIPDAGPGERLLRFRTGETNAWSALGPVHELNLVVPPAR